jgi:RHS repeat-associated protein
MNREEFTPYGETSFGSFAKKRYRFTGMERDEESGLSYHGARYYAAWVGRWVSCDPIGHSISAQISDNLYFSFDLNPMNFVDPMGESPEKPSFPGPINRFFQKIAWFFGTLPTDGSTGLVQTPIIKDEETIERDAELKKEIARKGNSKKNGSSGTSHHEPAMPTPDRPQRSGGSREGEGSTRTSGKGKGGGEHVPELPSSNPTTLKHFVDIQDFVLMSSISKEHDEIAENAANMEGYITNVLWSLATVGPASAFETLFADPEQISRATATVMVSPHMFGQRGGMRSLLRSPVDTQRELDLREQDQKDDRGVWRIVLEELNTALTRTN